MTQTSDDEVVVLSHTSTPSPHLETIDYKPPATSSSSGKPPMAPTSEEKKTDDHRHNNNNDHDEDHEDDHDRDDHDDHDDHGDLYSDEVAEWDEGGHSHCGYSEMVHHTLMSVGETVHKVIGEPTPRVEEELKAVGNWFQEASYAARDLFRGGKEGDDADASGGMTEDALDAVKTMFGGGKNDEDQKQQDEENKDPSGTTPTNSPSDPVGATSS